MLRVKHSNPPLAHTQILKKPSKNFTFASSFRVFPRLGLSVATQHRVDEAPVTLKSFEESSQSEKKKRVLIPDKVSKNRRPDAFLCSPRQVLFILLSPQQRRFSPLPLSFFGDLRFIRQTAHLHDLPVFHKFQSHFSQRVSNTSGCCTMRR